VNAASLIAEDLSIDIGGVAVVDGVSFAVSEGEVLALVGESGCGKSLTAFSLLGLLPPGIRVAKGRVTLDGADLTGLSEAGMERLRGRDISIIFQEPTASLDPLATVGDQIVEAYRIHNKGSRREAEIRAREMLVAVGISDPDRRMRQYPFELSGGMCQRIMIAIALICGPKFLIADEPTTALDVTIQAQILDLLRDLMARRRTGIVLITHDMGVVAHMADRVAIMYAGRIAEISPVAAIFRQPLHPYTEFLLASIPRPDVAPKAALMSIEGSVPSPREFPPGCRFATRCPLASDICKTVPPLRAVAAGRSLACWHRGEGG
jgi:peptide/nickel transport system ATP-binding protein